MKPLPTTPEGIDGAYVASVRGFAPDLSRFAVPLPFLPHAHDIAKAEVWDEPTRLKFEVVALNDALHDAYGRLQEMLDAHRPLVIPLQRAN